MADIFLERRDPSAAQLNSAFDPGRPEATRATGGFRLPRPRVMSLGVA